MHDLHWNLQIFFQLYKIVNTISNVIRSWYPLDHQHNQCNINHNPSLPLWNFCLHIIVPCDLIQYLRLFLFCCVCFVSLSCLIICARLFASLCVTVWTWLILTISQFAFGYTCIVHNNNGNLNIDLGRWSSVINIHWSYFHVSRICVWILNPAATVILTMTIVAQATKQNGHTKQTFSGWTANSSQLRWQMFLFMKTSTFQQFNFSAKTTVNSEILWFFNLNLYEHQI